MLPDTNLEGGVIFAERLRLRISGHRFLDDDLEVHLTVSVGVSEPIRGVESTVDEILKRADDALYRAKADGRNRVRS